MKIIKKMSVFILLAIIMICIFAVPTGADSKVAAPSDVSIYFNDERGICLQWTKVTGADKYRIYIYNSKTKKYEDVADTTGGLVHKGGR